LFSQRVKINAFTPHMERAMTATSKVILALALALAAPLPALAQDEMTADEISAALKKKPLTRSLKGDGGISKGDEMELREALSRSIGIRERKKIAEISKKAKLPSLDFSIRFAFDSAEIDPSSHGQLDQLATAMGGQDLGASTFLVNGHTDAKGSDAYNEELSLRRAEAVVSYLYDRHGIDTKRLKPIGYGESQPKDEYDPESGENRRVEIVNLPWED
jgi:outer membrane protein OmpA-like peptidoglycan-associated protein